MLQRFAHWNATNASKQDRSRWAILNKDAAEFDIKEFIQSQLTDISSWLERLNNNSLLVVTARTQAQKAADYILGPSEEKCES